MNHYVSSVSGGNDGARGFQEYLPALYSRSPSSNALPIITTAAGFACLSNAGKQPALASPARQMYLSAIQLVSKALSDPVECKTDETLAAVLLLGVFEAVSCGGQKAMTVASMRSWAAHTRGMAQLIELRGPDQFKTEASLGLFLQIRRLTLISYSQLCSPVPYSIRTWSKWAEAIQSEDEIPANRLAELIGDLIVARSWIKSHPDAQPYKKMEKLLLMDEALKQWPRKLPSYWTYEAIPVTKSRADENVNAHTGFDDEQDRYTDLYAASMWLSYRSARVQLHQTLMPLIMSNSDFSLVGKDWRLKASRQVLEEMTRGICRSVSFIMGDMPSLQHEIPNPTTISPPPTKSGNLDPAPGGYMLIWPLYMVGMLDTTTKAQRYWIARVLERIGIVSGASLAIARSKALLVAAEDDFRESEDWPYIRVTADPATI